MPNALMDMFRPRTKNGASYRRTYWSEPPTPLMIPDVSLPFIMLEECVRLCRRLSGNGWCRVTEYIHHIAHEVEPA